MEASEVEGAKVTTEEGREGTHQVGLPSSMQPDLPVFSTPQHLHVVGVMY